MRTSFVLLALLSVAIPTALGCEVSVKNVGLKTFGWRLSYAGNVERNETVLPGESSNHACLCLPHDMYVDYDGFYCYKYMNCIDQNQYEIEVGEYAIYINVGNNNVATCVL
eukprot:maker-scaffold75_size407189-snap-gene-3.14 protein:Tk10136 transcript:maker-scaffold75_size407189-snap-gene-3.14-mRNA-1 annotation:"50s ribosomal protein l27"